LIVEFNLIEIDKSKLSWQQSKDLKIKFSIALDPRACNKISNRREKISFELKFYDSAGNLINRDINGEPHRFKWELRRK
jgi:hypothetical protein